ncbi:rsbT co-antagonist protein RsbR [Bacillus mesophilus]|uniref:STAS domain-containing protein n=1 Tax=Bacillus mesophilus TaxID=1808955 RepID=A0A6M0QBY1_9BACI|nr:RsbT co-antagonist protein RsbRA [Bacillus mesophilus]MBM7663133.1 rsbT co-antagonist protein RsbR [Bacillus mesophilus]NEY73891.1 STAS domain-containing protein [Bacillus mesophilus]
MDTFLLALIRENQEEIVNKWLEEIRVLGNENSLRVVSDQLFLNTSREFVHLIITNVENTKEQLSVNLNDFSERIIKLGWPLSYITEGLQQFRKVIHCWLQERETAPAGQLRIMNEVNEWIDPIINHMVNHYSGSWEHTVSMQKMALQELSAPLIPVFDNITVMPLIGTIDTDRARKIMENLLQGVVKHRSEVVLIDITGVPVVDTMVAHHIIQAAEAVRLVGTKCLIVGIRPEIAQTIVNLGIDLSHIITKNSLKNGLESALNMTNRTIVKTSVGENK